MSRKSDAQTRAEAEVGEFQKGLGPFVVAGETTRMPIVFTNARESENPIIFVNDSFLSLSGHLRDELLGKSFRSLIAEDAGPEAMSAITTSFQRKLGGGCEVKCRHKDGREFWAALFINPVFDKQGKIIQHFVSFVDLTKHMQEQAHAKMLIDELNHRVKNILATVQSIIRQALSTNADRQTLRQVIKLRLSALSRSHDLLTREKWRSASLRQILTESLEPFKSVDSHADRFVITGADVRFPPSAALALGIVFNELATNALKYGALTKSGGTVHIDWRREAAPQGPQLTLTWRETGGPRVKTPAHRGFGTRMIERGLSHELNGTGHLDYRPDGLVCTMNIPAPDNQHG